MAPRSSRLPDAFLQVYAVTWTRMEVDRLAPSVLHKMKPIDIDKGDQWVKPVSLSSVLLHSLDNRNPPANPIIP